MQQEYELNPFEDHKVASEWITSVENEQGLIRDEEIYPLLKKWVAEIDPKVLIEIGSGQGICSEKANIKQSTNYIGIEPSTFLVARAKELYTESNRNFILGNAYKLPVEDNIADAVFSINVWFHLSNLEKASKELSRILKSGGRFLIITANPNSYEEWESFHFDYTKEGKKILGKVNVPINPMSLNVFYQHELENIQKELTSNGLDIIKITEFGAFKAENHKLFISIAGKKHV